MTDQTDISVQIGDIKKNAKETIRVSLSSYKGSVFLDIRTWYLDDKKILKPSSKGVTLNPSLIPEFAAIVRSAEGEAKARGLLLATDSDSVLKQAKDDEHHSESTAARLVDGLF